jgi:hypothetical protein
VEKPVENVEYFFAYTAFEQTGNNVKTEKIEHFRKKRIHNSEIPHCFLILLLAFWVR